MKNTHIGHSPPRVDGMTKASGSAIYVDDIQTPGALFGGTLRSSTARGRLLSIDIPQSFDMSEIVLVTADDIPGENVIAALEADQPALVAVGSEIRHCDQAIALIAAPTKERVAAALAAIEIQVEALDVVLDLESAEKADTVLYGTNNVFKHIVLEKGNDIETALAACDIVIEGHYQTGSQEQMYIETQGIISNWPQPDCCVVTGSLQCPHYVQAALTRLLNLGDEQVIVRQAVTGGGFGGKEEYPSMIAAHAALLSLKAAMPVRLIYSREEDIGATPKRHPSRIRHRLGLLQDGTIHAADIEIALDGGAYVTLSPVVLSRAVIHASGPYRIPHIRVIGKVFATNHPPFGAFRGFGAPQVTFAYERQIQKAVQQLGADAFEFRQRNRLRQGDHTATGQLLTEHTGGAEVLAKVQAAICLDSDALRLDPDLLRLPGEDIAFCFHGAGFTGSGEAYLSGQVCVGIDSDGFFEIRTSSTDIGQGALTTFSQIAAESLGIKADDIRIAAVSTDNVPDSGPTVASRTCMIVGGLIAEAAQQFKLQVEQIAKQENISYSHLSELFRLLKDRNLNQSNSYKQPANIHWDETRYQGSAYPTYGWACCYARVSVDPDTFEVQVEQLIHAIDVGRAINPVIVLGQIEGGTLQALGWALSEHIVYQQGRVANRRFTDCIIPTSLDAPEIEAILVECEYTGGPFGAKGVGEIPMDCPAAAIAGALAKALKREMDQLPLLPEHLLEKATPCGDSDAR